MDKAQIIEKINAFLVEDFEIEEGKLLPEANFKKDLGIDSLDIVDVVVMVDKAFGVKIKAEDLRTVTTLQAFYDFIDAKLNG
ncbi:MAG: acyl carrier protein [Bacteroidales bacterium]|nr:acyl carrier protein [Bacteroidales bacterium]